MDGMLRKNKVGLSKHETNDDEGGKGGGEAR